MFRKLGSYLLVLLLSLGWFGWLQTWGSFRDPDAFYHARAAEMTGREFVIKQFSSLDLTSLGTVYADQHWLFHVVTVPFQGLMGMLMGQQVASVALAAMFALVFYACLHRWVLRGRWVWMVLLLTSFPLFFRYSLVKASPLAGIWFVVGVSLMLPSSDLLPFGKLRAFGWYWIEYVLAASVGMGFALSHGGWSLLLRVQGCLMVGAVVYERFVRERSWKEAVQSSGWQILLSTLVGIVVGALMHPNGMAYLQFLWVQVVKVGVLTSSRVVLGQEWFPFEPMELVRQLLSLILVAFGLLYGLVFGFRSPLDHRVAKNTLALMMGCAVLLALSFKSRRMLEYFVPLLVLCFVQLAQLVDWKRVLEDVKSMKLLRVVPGRVALMVVTVLLVGLMGRDAFLGRAALFDGVKPFAQYRGAMEFIVKEAPTGTRVYHSDWDQWPQLFAHAPTLRFISGMDPTFLLEAHPELSDLHRDVMLGKATSTSMYEIVHDRFQSAYVFVPLDRREAFAQRVRDESRFERVYQDEEAEVYKVR